MRINSPLVRRLLATAAVATAAFMLPAGARAVEANVPVVAPYVAAFTPEFSPGHVPYSGTMMLVFDNGIISGTYRGTSVAPDRLDDVNTPVSGTVDGEDVYFTVGHAMEFRGRLLADGSLSGTLTSSGRFYEFLAKPGTPRS